MCVAAAVVQTTPEFFFSFFLFFRVGFPTCLLICGQIWNCLELSYWVIFQFYSHELYL
jgi:hypothetical protein